MNKQLILKRLGNEFDKAHKEQLKRTDKKDADYYMFMGVASGIGKAIDIVEELTKNKE